MGPLTPIRSLTLIALCVAPVWAQRPKPEPAQDPAPAQGERPKPAPAARPKPAPAPAQDDAAERERERVKRAREEARKQEEQEAERVKRARERALQEQKQKENEAPPAADVRGPTRGDLRLVVQDMFHVEELHRDRLARLERLAAIYRDSNDQAHLAEVEQLLVRQNKRYGAVMAQFREKLGPAYESYEGRLMAGRRGEEKAEKSPGARREGPKKDVEPAAGSGAPAKEGARRAREGGGK